MNKIKILSPEEINESLRELPGWNFKSDKLIKEFKFPTFTEGINFISKLAPFCERIDHHPDIFIKYNKIRFELQCFDVGGKVTDKDVQLAKEIEKLHK